MAFEKIRKLLGREPKDLPEGLWQKCRECSKMVLNKELEENGMVCTECGYHFTLNPAERIGMLLDDDSFAELWGSLESCDPLKFDGEISYREKYEKAQEKTGLKDACITGTGKIDGHKVVFGMTTPTFMMGSMGSVVGEKVARCFEYGSEHGLPVVFVSGSGGGARMYEGVLSLMQMAKTSAAISRFSQKGGLYISILTNPTMAGVMASFASLGDITLAEPRALIGFTGPRVIEQTIKQELPPGFQTSEFLLDHGFIDRVIERQDLKKEVAELLEYFC